MTKAEQTRLIEVTNRILSTELENLPDDSFLRDQKGLRISTETNGVRYPFWCRYKCSLCGGLSDRTNFCPNCGARMVDPQESEDKKCI